MYTYTYICIYLNSQDSFPCASLMQVNQTSGSESSPGHSEFKTCEDEGSVKSHVCDPLLGAPAPSSAVCAWECTVLCMRVCVCV